MNILRLCLRVSKFGGTINVNYRYVDSELAYIFDNADLVVVSLIENFFRILKLFIQIFLR